MASATEIADALYQQDEFHRILGDLEKTLISPLIRRLLDDKGKMSASTRKVVKQAVSDRTAGNPSALSIFVGDEAIVPADTIFRLNDRIRNRTNALAMHLPLSYANVDRKIWQEAIKIAVNRTDISRIFEAVFLEGRDGRDATEQLCLSQVIVGFALFLSEAVDMFLVIFMGDKSLKIKVTSKQVKVLLVVEFVDLVLNSVSLIFNYTNCLIGAK